VVQQRALSVTRYRETAIVRERVRERLKESFWFTPGLFAVAAIALAMGMHQFDRILSVHAGEIGWWEGSVENAAAIASSVSTSMLTFLGVVFSITLVAVQMGAAQFSPRVVRTFARSGITKVALGTFMATFIYALLTQNFLAKGPQNGQQIVPIASVTVAILLVLASLAVFLIFVSALIRLIRLPFLVSTIATETREAIQINYPPREAYMLVDESRLGEPDAVLAYDCPPGWALLAPHTAHGVLQGLDVRGLVRLAVRHDCVLRLLPRLGEYVSGGEPILEVYGSHVPPRDRILRNFDVGRERTLYQDPAYSVRQLVDVAAQALSAAINAPTSAVQIIDRLTALLLMIARRPEPTGLYADRQGAVRLIVPVHSWSDIVDLTFTEIRVYGVQAPQVTRRLSAAIDDLLSAVPDERKPALLRQRDLLCDAVARVVDTPAGRETALEPDRLGLG
jgi:uncharacterized membrane protein